MAQSRRNGTPKGIVMGAGHNAGKGKSRGRSFRKRAWQKRQREEEARKMMEEQTQERVEEERRNWAEMSQTELEHWFAQARKEEQITRRAA